MRLIDADALADALYDKRKNYPQWVADVIGEMPTIDTDAMLKEQDAVVRCKDCIHRGKAEKCVLAAISEEKDYPLFMLDNRGEWFCADGVAKDINVPGKEGR